MRTELTGGGYGLHHPRPWRAEPMDRREPDGPWQVICPSKTGRPGDIDTVAEWVCEVDAKAIADGGNRNPI